MTGYGVVSPLGNNVERFWKNIKEGKSGIKKIQSDDFKDIGTQIGGFITDFNVENILIKKN